MKITARYTVIVMLALSVSLTYSFRSVVVMINPYLVEITGTKVKQNISTFVCERPKTAKKLKPLTNLTEPINRKHSMKIGYDSARAAAHVVSGISCDRTGGRYIILITVLVGAILLLLYPTLLLSCPPWAMMMHNIATGAAGGYGMPALMTLIASWAPINRKTLFVGMVYAGSPISKVLQYIVVEYFTVIHHQWESVFYVFSIMGVIYCLFYLCTVFSKPGMHPLISSEEKLFLQRQLGTRLPKRIPWKHIIKDTRVLAILFGKLSHLWIQNIDYGYLQTYFALVLRMDLLTMGGFYMIVPHLLHIACGILAAVLVQRAINKDKVQLTQLRIFCTMFGAVAPAVFMLLMSFAECNTVLARTLACMAICSMATMNLGTKANILDLTYHFAGFCEALINGVATMVVMMLPKLMAAIITEHSVYVWRRFFWITLALTSFLATMHYMFVGSDRAKWDNLRADNSVDYDEDFEDTAV